MFIKNGFAFHKWRSALINLSLNKICPLQLHLLKPTRKYTHKNKILICCRPFRPHVSESPIHLIDNHIISHLIQFYILINLYKFKRLIRTRLIRNIFDFSRPNQRAKGSFFYVDTFYFLSHRLISIQHTCMQSQSEENHMRSHSM